MPIMKDFNKFKTRFVQFGGMRLVCQYARMGVLWAGIKALLRCTVSGKSLKAVYPSVTERVDEILIERYHHILDENKEGFYKANSNPVKHQGTAVPRIIWSAWLQGLGNAPEMVNVCLESHKKHLPGYEFRVLDMENYHKWVELPDYVLRKYQKGLIPPASFSDMIRLAVLKKYGGVWMDATVFCSGFGNDNLKKRWAHIMRSEITVFRYFERGRREASGLSTWFLAAEPHQFVVSTVLDMLLAYWKDFDCLVDYYIIHLFLGLVLDECPQSVLQMPRENSFHSLFLGDALSRTYRQDAWQELVDHVAIHKLNYRKADEALKNPNSYYNFIRK